MIARIGPRRESRPGPAAPGLSQARPPGPPGSLRRCPITARTLLSDECGPPRPSRTPEGPRGPGTRDPAWGWADPSLGGLRASESPGVPRTAQRQAGHGPMCSEVPQCPAACAGIGPDRVQCVTRDSPWLAH
eukprot:331602-Hanusia_phi.AAC.2